ncbi:threonine synthase [Blattabacterium cuenoti]|uniref:threonine synthase n=1 Tax=Blattabacterium cuenoti TaxID=1653831 RepID=UPI00163C2754|nr:threonine synthase [Blattabacterium cuenoti]
MLYYSLNNFKNYVSFKTAVLTGLAIDGGLYFPEKIPKIKRTFIQNIKKYDNYSIAMEVIKPYIGEYISEEYIDKIIHNTLNFSFPLKKIYENIYVLELFHGPTLAFKDVGAKFMAGCLSYFYKTIGELITVLVATSGDTGGAVAKGFHNVSGIEVIILYPHKGVSDLQEKQITSLGDNIFPLEIKGNFDNCQYMVKKAFLDKEIKNKYLLTSANSINIARWLPQMFYYFIAYKKIIEKNQKIIFSVPSGNFGNICAGMLAEKMGLPIKYFIASTNINDTIPRFLKGEKYHPLPVKKTISNAMDISNPSNFSRILHLYKNNIFKLKKKLCSYKFTDEETFNIIKKVWSNYKYILDPHGAIGYLGIKKYLKLQKVKTHFLETAIFLETAHPIKFLDKMPFFLRKKIFLSKEEKFRKKLKIKKKISLSNNYNFFKDWLIKRRR